MTQIQTKYSELKKKLPLPDFEKLDFEFEVSLIEDEKFLLREIRRKIAEKIEFYCKVIDELLHPDVNLKNITESENLTEDQKNSLFELYCKLMLIFRTSLKLGIKNDEKETVLFINSTLNEWISLKDDLTTVFQLLSQSWQKKNIRKENLEYLG